MNGISAVGTASGQVPAVQPRLVQAAHEFEGQLMKELLRPMMSTGMSTGGLESEEDNSQSAMGEFACEALGQSLSKHGGLGLAATILRQLSQNGTNSGNSPGSEQPESKQAISGSGVLK